MNKLETSIGKLQVLIFTLRTYITGTLEIKTNQRKIKITLLVIFFLLKLQAQINISKHIEERYGQINKQINK